VPNSQIPVPSEPLYISVDIETAGPNPSTYSLLTIGACTVEEKPATLYLELKPVNNKLTPESFALHHLDLKRLAERGLEPAQGMRDFEDWIRSVTPNDRPPIFVGFNAPFDWMFVSDYFHRYLGHNPFGHAAVDIKAFYMGLTGAPWRETGLARLASRYLGERTMTHHALRDALDQADMFRQMLAEARGLSRQ
jgi:ribonuclease T